MLFAFGLGTLPVLSAFGVLTTLISASLTHRLLKASGVIVVVLGAVMINRGLILTGSGYDLASLAGRLRKSADVSRQAPAPSPPTTMAPAPKAPASQTIEMEANRFGYSPKRFVLSKGVPVKWVIDGKEITNCNKRIVAPALNLEFDVKKGVQTIEFTPAKAGVVPWSCWMGMLRGEFEVVDAPPAARAARRRGRARAFARRDAGTRRDLYDRGGGFLAPRRQGALWRREPMAGHRRRQSRPRSAPDAGGPDRQAPRAGSLKTAGDKIGRAAARFHAARFPLANARRPAR